MKQNKVFQKNKRISQLFFIDLVANGDQATADALLRREIMGGSPTSQLNRYGNDISTVNS